MFLCAHTDTVAELQGYVHWLKSLGWNIPGFAEKGGRKDGLCDCTLEQEGGVEERGLTVWGGVGWLQGGIREKFLTEHLSASFTTVNTPPSLASSCQTSGPSPTSLSCSLFLSPRLPTHTQQNHVMDG